MKTNDAILPCVTVPQKGFPADWEWYEPPENSPTIIFFSHTSLHGLQYLAQKKRHLCERIFWLLAFTAAVIFSGVLMWRIIYAYINTPIITVFNPVEIPMEHIPFPTVTICNVNNVKNSKWLEYNREAAAGLRGELSNETTLRKLANIFDIYQICHKDRTFTTKFRNHTFEDNEVTVAVQRYHQDLLKYLNPIGTLQNARPISKNQDMINNSPEMVSQSCKDMIPFCLWLGKTTDCNDLFQEIATDFGICCSFNTLPLSLLIRQLMDDTSVGPEKENVNDWREANLNNDNLVAVDEPPTHKYPFRQHYTGRTAGLSFMVDPELHEYHCSNIDSEGFVVGLTTPIEFPRMKDNGIAIRTSSEVFISIVPEITMIAETAKRFEKEHRQCYLDGEMELEFYTKYTPSNCVDECIAKKTLAVCSCLRYYMPRPRKANDSTVACDSIEKFMCTENVRENITVTGVERECSHCWPTCSEILYHAESTSLRVQENPIKALLQRLHPNPDTIKNVSIVHIYLNVDSVFPRLRKEMTTTINLISEFGGLLGLCMGFSILSMLEVLYHVTLRLLCNSYRKHTLEKTSRKMSMESGMTNWKGDSGCPQFSDQTNMEYLSKLFQHQRISVQNVEDKQNEYNLPMHLPTPFEADFQRAYVSTIVRPH